MFYYTVGTAKSVDEAVQALEAALKERQFGVLWSLDLTAKLAEKGLSFPSAYRILEVCNPVQAERVLSKNLLVGYFLPCKIAVYEEEGTTKIGLPKPSVLMGVVNDPSLAEIGAEVERVMIEAVEAAR